MKIVFSVLLVAGIGFCLGQAAENAQAPKGVSLTPEQRQQYADLIRGEVETGAQVKLLVALADEYLKRSKESQQPVPAERAAWEAEMGEVLRSRSTAMLSQLNELTKKRLAFETEYGTSLASAAALGSLQEPRALNPAELAYVTKLDERQLKIQQELVLVEEASKGLYAQLQTNTTAEAVGNVSVLLDLNAKQSRQLEWALGDVELHKLAFRAMRR